MQLFRPNRAINKKKVLIKSGDFCYGAPAIYVQKFGTKVGWCNCQFEHANKFKICMEEKIKHKNI